MMEGGRGGMDVDVDGGREGWMDGCGWMDGWIVDR